jgi:hypothetical protein
MTSRATRCFVALFGTFGSSALSGCMPDLGYLQTGDSTSQVIETGDGGNEKGDGSDALAPRADATRDADATPDGDAASMPDARMDAPVDPCSKPEICNGLDDNCNGKVDEGCPKSLSVTFNTDHAHLGASTGGNTFGDSCSPDSVLIGMRVVAGAWIYQVNGVCAKYILVVDKQKIPYEYRVGVTLPLSDLPAHPMGSTNFPDDLVCPADHVLSELWIGPMSHDPNPVIASAKLVCQKLGLARTPTGAWTVTRSDDQIAGPRGVAAVAPSVKDSVTGDLVPIHLIGSAGAWLDRLGIGDGKLAVEVY